MLDPEAQQHHPGLEALGALADRSLTPEHAATVQAHLAGCPPCFALYAAAVEARVEERQSALRSAAAGAPELASLVEAPSPALIAAGLAVAGPRSPVASPRGKVRRARARRWRPWAHRWRFAGAGIGAAAALAVFVVVPTLRWQGAIGPVRDAMAQSSARGLQYPDVHPSDAGPIEAYRTGTPSASAPLSAAIRELSLRYERDPGAWRVAYWLVAARMEADQLPQARSILNGALRTSPQHPRLRALDGMLAHREGRLQASAAIFESLASERPGGAVAAAAAANLARVRAQLQPPGPAK